MTESEFKVSLRELALLEINFLNHLDLLPKNFEGLEADSTQIEIFGLASDGVFDEIFHRVSLISPGDPQRTPVAFFEYAVAPLFGSVLLAIGIGDQGTLRSAGLQQVGESDLLVAYNYPKRAILRGSKGNLSLEAFSSRESIAFAMRKQGDPVGYTDAWNLKDELSPIELTRRTNQFNLEIGFWTGLLQESRNKGEIVSVSSSWFEQIVQKTCLQSTRPPEGDTLFRMPFMDVIGLQGQRDEAWCVPACLQMILKFYRYTYDQLVLALALGLGEEESGRRLVRTAEYEVVRLLEKVTREAFRSRMIRSPEWIDIRGELDLEKPVIGLTEGHCRIIVAAAAITANYKSSEGQKEFLMRGFSILDPWPVNAGTKICWESVDTVKYISMFSGELDLLSQEELGVVEIIKGVVRNLIAEQGGQWGLSRDVDVKKIERLETETGEIRWLAAVGEGDKLAGAVLLGSDLKSPVFGRLTRPDGAGAELSFLDRESVRPSILRQASDKERVSEPRLFLREEQLLLWQAKARASNGSERTIAPPDIQAKIENLRD